MILRCAADIVVCAGSDDEQAVVFQGLTEQVKII